MDHSQLTEREQEILGFLAGGASDREIADRLFLTVGTVKWYNRQIYSKLGARNRTHAIQEARRTGLLTPEQPPAADAHTSESTFLGSALPTPITSFVGRKRELHQLQRLLRETRLVTLTGAPGTGKTRLALEAAAAVANSFSDGVCFVSLAALSDSDLVASEICRALSLQESAAQTPADLLFNYTRHRRLLFVLDNFEHLLAATPLVADLLMRAPGLVVLATSREMLHLYGETEYPLLPLSLPDITRVASVESLYACESVALFVQRARATLPEFALDELNAAAVAMICVQLDGLPLAIELAAARLRFYSPASLLLRLSSRLETLSKGPRNLPQRQQTLRATLAWSYDRLEPDEQRLFARLGVFAGGCTVDDAEEVCGNGLSICIAAGIESLVEKNLIYLQPAAQEEPRIMMLETMREYAVEQLERNGETRAIRARHAQHFLTLAENGTQAMPGPQTGLWVRRMREQHDNLRTALQWSISAAETQEAARAAYLFLGYMAAVWDFTGQFTEARRWFAQLEQQSAADEVTQERAKALWAVGQIAYFQGDYAAAEALCRGALSVSEQLGDPVLSVRALAALSDVAAEVGDTTVAFELAERASVLARDTGDTLLIARAVAQLGFCSQYVGELETAQKWLEESLQYYCAAGDRVGEALVVSSLGEAAIRQNRLGAADALLERSLAIRRELGYPWGIAVSLGSLAWVAMLRKEWAHARRLLEESLFIRNEIGDVGGLAWCLEKLAELAWQRKDAERAVRILGAAAALRASVNSVIQPSDRPAYEQFRGELRATLDGEHFAALWAEGEAFGLDRAIQHALLWSETEPGG